MGKASSSKKVQRAARAAASSRGTGESRERAFPILVGVIVLLGIGMVLIARGSREDPSAPLLDDHWHSAYTFYDCGEAQPAIPEGEGPDGIHTHGNGLIHIHPFNSSATGTDARTGVFFSAHDVSVSEDQISGPFGTIDLTTGCGDEDAEIVAARWVIGPDGPTLETRYVADFDDIRFLSDREGFTFAKVAVGEDPPAPSEASLAQLDATTGVAAENLEFDPEVDQPAVPTDGDDPAASSSTTTPPASTTTASSGSDSAEEPVTQSGDESSDSGEE